MSGGVESTSNASERVVPSPPCVSLAVTAMRTSVAENDGGVQGTVFGFAVPAIGPAIVPRCVPAAYE